MAALVDWMSRVLGHKKELFLRMIALASVKVSAGWTNPVTVSVILAAANTTAMWDPRTSESVSLKSDSECEHFTPMIQSPLFVRKGSFVTSIVVG
jgi:hypothetical protein